MVKTFYIQCNIAQKPNSIARFSSKVAIFLFYMSILQFTAAFAVMTGIKGIELAKTTQATTTTTTAASNQKIHSIVPSLTTVQDIHPNARRILITQLFELEKQPCEVNDSSNNKRTRSNCSSSASVSPRVKKCSLNSRLVGESCMCNEGYRKFPFSDECVKVNGQPCMFHQNDCNTELTNLACINNVCSCEDSDIYDHTTFQCVGRVGGLCYPEIKDCTANAECANVPTTGAAKRVLRPRESFGSTSSSSYYYYETDQLPHLTDYVLSSGSDIELGGRCQCKKGFVESQGGLCKKAYGQTCTFGDECDSMNLVCKEGLCSCPDVLHVYDLVSKSCVALVGARCSNEPGGTLCVKYAFCEKVNLKLDGKCACIEDAVETSLRMCVHSSLTAESVPISSVVMADNNNNKNERTSKRILFDL